MAELITKGASDKAHPGIWWARVGAANCGRHKAFQPAPPATDKVVARAIASRGLISYHLEVV